MASKAGRKPYRQKDRRVREVTWIRLLPEERARLKELAQAEERSMAAQIRVIIREYLDRAAEARAL